jgi:hypothetical protein
LNRDMDADRTVSEYDDAWCTALDYRTTSHMILCRTYSHL